MKMRAVTMRHSRSAGVAGTREERPIAMLMNIVIGSCLVILTTFLHAAAMVIIVQRLRVSNSTSWIGQAGLGFRRAALVAEVVLGMFLASLVESGSWAATYLFVDAIPDFEHALYFSTVTYTTLGFGDVVLPERWRLLSSFEAANGILMFGWTTAMIAWTVQRVYGIALNAGDRPNHEGSNLSLAEDGHDV